MSIDDKQVLDLVVAIPGVSSGEIAVHLGVAHDSVKDALRRMATENLVEQRRPAFIQRVRMVVWHPTRAATGNFVRRVVPASECAPVMRTQPVSVFNLEVEEA